jgi:DNA-binding NarL/FixJ family response regulator
MLSDRSLVRILVVEDHVLWQELAVRTLREQPGLQIIGVVADGLEAVQQAEELQPDLVLLDIGLPRLNGIEVAKRVRKVAPGARILFVSQESSSEIVRETVRVGGLGYIHKPHGSELLPAIQAVRKGTKFFGRGLEAQESSGDTEDHTLGHHNVQFCSDDGVFLEAVARFVAAALRAGGAAIAIVTKSHWDDLLESLRAEDLDIDGAVRRGTCIWQDARETLSTIMVNGMPDPVLFLDGLRGLVESASRATKGKSTRVAICGERTGLLWAEGKADAAIRLEQLCNELRKTHQVDVLCAYAFGLPALTDQHAFGYICAEHSAVFSG